MCNYKEQDREMTQWWQSSLARYTKPGTAMAKVSTGKAAWFFSAAAWWTKPYSTDFLTTLLSGINGKQRTISCAK